MDIRVRNNVRELGLPTAQPLVFVHGFGCDQSMWDGVAPRFASSFRVVLFDHVGAGGSDLGAYDSAKYGTLQGYADDVVEICRALGLERVVFVGHSVSAMIGVLAAAAAPELGGSDTRLPSPYGAGPPSDPDATNAMPVLRGDMAPSISA